MFYSNLTWFSYISRRRCYYYSYWSVFKILLFELNNLTTSPWGDLERRLLDDRRLSAILKPYGVKSETIRTVESPCKGYKLDSFKDAFIRYLPACTPQISVASVTTVTTQH